MSFKNFFRKILNHEHSYVLDHIHPKPISDWRVSQNLHHEIWICDVCGQKQWRSDYYDEDLNPQEPIPPLQGDCELSLR